MVQQSNFKINFIAGMPRSGTTWLMKSLNQHPEILAYGETSFFGRNRLKKEIYTKEDVAKLSAIYGKIPSTWECPIPNQHLSELLIKGLSLSDLDQEETIDIHKLFRNLNQYLLDKTGKSVVFEKTPHHIFHIHELINVYHASQFIILKREPKSFFNSYKNLSLSKEGKLKKKLNRLYHPFILTIQYKTYYSKIEETMTKKNCLIIDYQDIKINPKDVLDRCCKSIGVSPFDFKIEVVNSSFRGNTVPPELSAYDVAWLNLLGIIKKGSTRKYYLPAFGSLLTLPLWLYWVSYYHIKDLGFRRLIRLISNYI